MSQPAPATRWVLRASAPGQAEVVVGVPEGEFSVGREPGCHLVLNGKLVSRKHAILHVEEATILVEDLGSYNGTLVEGARIKKASLKNGDAVTIGEWSLKLELPKKGKDGAALEVLKPSTTLETTARAFENGPTMSLEMPLKRAQATPGDGVPSAPTPPSDRRSVAPALTPARKSGAVPVVQWNSAHTPGEEMRERAVGQSPLLRKLTEQLTPLNVSDAAVQAQQLAHLARQSDATQELALRLVYQVAAEIRDTRGEEEFLARMADTVLQATKAQTVAFLMKDDGVEGPLEPRIVRGQAPETRFSRSVVEMALQKGVAVSSEDAGTDTRFNRRESVLNLDLKAVLAVPMMRDNHPVGVIYLTRRVPLTDAEQDLVAALGHLAALGIERARLREQVAEQEALRLTLERFHTPEVVEKLMERAGPGKAGGMFLENITATVLFCDLCGFTNYCDNHTTAEVAELLNRYLGEMTRVVYEFHGTVDKFIGDAVMAVFGAPFPADDDPTRAARCAIAMQKAFSALMATRAEKERLQLRVGINTGPVVAGTVGSTMRMEYTCLGDTVNVAQRLEGKAEPGTILMGKATADAVGAQFKLKGIGPLNLKGKSDAVEAFVLDGEK